MIGLIYTIDSNTGALQVLTLDEYERAARNHDLDDSYVRPDALSAEGVRAVVLAVRMGSN
jgi:hypothetical protein